MSPPSAAEPPIPPGTLEPPLLAPAAAQALHDSATLRAMFNMPAVGAAMMDLDGRLLAVNDRYCAITGRTRDELLRTTVAALIHPDDRETGRQAMADYLAGTTPGYQAEKRYLHRDGRQIWVRVTAALVRGADGRAQYSVGIVEDITEARQVLDRLRFSEEMFAAAFANNPAAIALTRLDDGRVLDVNDTWLAMTGEQRQHIVGRTARFMWPNPEDAKRFLQALHAQGIVHGWGQPFRTKDGRSFVTQISAQVLTLRGEPTILSTLVDITARKHAEAEWQEREALLRTLTSRARVGMVMVNAERRYMFANAAYAEILGLPSADIVGLRVAEVLPAVYEAQIRPRLDQAFAGASVHYELRVPQRPGWDGERAFDVNYDPPVDTVHGPCVIVVIVDITERMRAQLALQELAGSLERRVQARTAELAAARDAADAANRAKSTFLANMSHEIRTPMNAILGLTHLMSRDSTDPRQRERLGRVDEAARHLLQILNDILDLSKIEAGKMALEDIEFTLEGVLSASLELVRERAAHKGLELVLDTGRLPARLRGDPTRLSQALINLLANAVKFTEAGWVSLRCRIEREEPEHLLVRFEVQDTGEGIAADRLQAIFSAFEQADASTTRRHGGTGLGLALTRHLATMMGGEAGVHSTLGTGSTFWFSARLGRAGADADAPLLQGLRALVVDDLPVAREALAERLRSFGMQVEAAEDCSAALRLAQHMADTGAPPAVLLIDWQMTPEDGLATLQRLRGPLGQVLPPAILVTAFEDARLHDSALAAGFAEVLVKPVNASALHDTLARLLRRAWSAPVPATRGDPGLEQQLRQRHAGQRILVVEDNPINQVVAAELLRGAGLQVDLADGGEQALERVRDQRYDLILMDVQMPGMNGLTATTMLRTELRCETPVVAMTANAFAEDRAACLEAGMNDHLAKPVDPAALFAKLLHWLPPAAAGDALAGRLQAEGGLDALQALQRVGGRAHLLQRMVERFVATYDEGLPALLRAADAGDLPACRTQLNSLRGACAAIGATSLVAQIDALGGSAPAALPAGVQALEADLLAQVTRLRAALAR